MKQRIIAVLLLLSLVLAGCSTAAQDPVPVQNTQKFLTRLNFYSANGNLLDQYRLEYDSNGVPISISSGIMQDEQYEASLTGAPMLPPGVDLSQTDDSYSGILLAPCTDGTALLVRGTAADPLWGMVLYGAREDYVEQNGYLTKVVAGDGSYVALFYEPLYTAASDADSADSVSLPVTENSDYYGYDEVLNALGAAVLAMQREEPATLSEMMFSSLYASEPRKEAIGYAFVDLDNNGVKELIVGSNGQYGRSVIYDLYAIYNGKIVNVLSGTENARHTLSSKNEILLDSQNDAGQTVFAAFSYYNSSIRLLEAVIQGRGERFHSTQSFNDPDTFEAISYTDAAAIQESYTAVEIDFTPINDYIAASGLETAGE